MSISLAQMKLRDQQAALEKEKTRTSYKFGDLNQKMRNLKAEQIRNQ